MIHLFPKGNDQSHLENEMLSGSHPSVSFATVPRGWMCRAATTSALEGDMVWRGERNVVSRSRAVLSINYTQSQMINSFKRETHPPFERLTFVRGEVVYKNNTLPVFKCKLFLFAAFLAVFTTKRLFV